MNDADFDSAIDRALESYAAGEPDPGLAGRIVATARLRRAAKMSGSARAWALAAAASLVCVAMATGWMKSEHLQIAILHTDGAQPAAQTPVTTAAIERPQNSARPKASPGEGRKMAAKARGPVVLRTASKRETAAEAGGEQLVAEGVEPIVFKPIEMAPIRMEAPGQGLQ